jgi:hypothetical protein
MATQRDVRRIAMKLAGTIASDTDVAFAVMVNGKAKGYAWSWKERIDPKKARVPNLKVLAVRVADLDEKDALLAGDPDVFFTEPHYHGFPAVLIRLDAITAGRLAPLLARAHELMTVTKRSRAAARGRSGS